MFNKKGIIAIPPTTKVSWFPREICHEYGLDGIAQGLNYFQPWKLKDFLCDFLGISHLSSKEQIINELKTRF